MSPNLWKLASVLIWDQLRWCPFSYIYISCCPKQQQPTYIHTLVHTMEKNSSPLPKWTIHQNIVFKPDTKKPHLQSITYSCHTKTKMLQFWRIFLTGCNRSYNFWCTNWRNFPINDSISVSVHNSWNEHVDPAVFWFSNELHNPPWDFYINSQMTHFIPTVSRTDLACWIPINQRALK